MPAQTAGQVVSFLSQHVWLAKALFFCTHFQRFRKGSTVRTMFIFEKIAQLSSALYTCPIRSVSANCTCSLLCSHNNNPEPVLVVFMKKRCTLQEIKKHMKVDNGPTLYVCSILMHPHLLALADVLSRLHRHVLVQDAGANVGPKSRDGQRGQGDFCQGEVNWEF
jgi:hypothetical protein